RRRFTRHSDGIGVSRVLVEWRDDWSLSSSTGLHLRFERHTGRTSLLDHIDGKGPLPRFVPNAIDRHGLRVLRHFPRNLVLWAIWVPHEGPRRLLLGPVRVKETNRGVCAAGEVDVDCRHVWGECGDQSFLVRQR